MPYTRLKLTTRFFGGKSSKNNPSSTSTTTTPSLPPTAAHTQALVSLQSTATELTTQGPPVADYEYAESTGFVGELVVEATEENESDDGAQARGQKSAINIFPGSHGNTFNQPTFVAEFTQNVGEPVLKFLERKLVEGTDLESASRIPPPRCHPDTRLELRKKLEEWLQDPQRRSFMTWLAGPAGAGKSAVAQTFAELCRDLGRLGVAYFFSTLNGRGKVEGLMPGIVYTLAKKDQTYQRLVNTVLGEQPDIFQRDFEFQFRKLISEPLDQLTPDGKPLVFIIDGLDECDSKQTQCEIVRVIGQYATSLKAKRYSTLWLICSRPERHIQLAFSLADGYRIDDAIGRTKSYAEFEWRINYTREDITCDAEADKQDVLIILKSGLQIVRDRYVRRHPEDAGSMKEWPRQTQLGQLSDCICGLPILASTVIKFIGSERKHPNRQLDLCLVTLRDLPARIKELKRRDEANPLEGLDLFYSAIMRNVEKSVLTSAKHLIGFLITLSLETQWLEKIHTASDTRVFFGLDKPEFDYVLEDLHSVLNIPSGEAAEKQPIQFFHKSFGEYLQSQYRAQDYALDMIETRLEVARHAIRIYGDVIRSNCKQGCDQDSKTAGLSADELQNLDWYQEDQLFANAQIRRFVRTNFWNMLCLDDSKRSDLVESLQDFEFRHLAFLPSMGTIDETNGLPQFLSWMSKAIESPDVTTILRIKPATEEDTLLFKHCLSEPPLRKKFPQRVGERNRYSYSFISTHRQDKSERTVPHNTKMAFWIGAGERAGLGLIYGSAKEDEDDE